jgi:hypothetical protein
MGVEAEAEAAQGFAAVFGQALPTWRCSRPIFAFQLRLPLRLSSSVSGLVRQQFCHGLALGLSLLAMLAQGVELGTQLGPLLTQRVEAASVMLVQMNALGQPLLVALYTRVIDDRAQQLGTVASLAGIECGHAQAMLLGNALYLQPQFVATASLLGKRHAGLAFAQFAQSCKGLQAFDCLHCINSIKARTVWP